MMKMMIIIIHLVISKMIIFVYHYYYHYCYRYRYHYRYHYHHYHHHYYQSLSSLYKNRLSCISVKPHFPQQHRSQPQPPVLLVGILKAVQFSWTSKPPWYQWRSLPDSRNCHQTWAHHTGYATTNMSEGMFYLNVPISIILPLLSSMCFRKNQNILHSIIS